jgi:hypothetical protein
MLRCPVREMRSRDVAAVDHALEIHVHQWRMVLKRVFVYGADGAYTGVLEPDFDLAGARRAWRK